MKLFFKSLFVLLMALPVIFNAQVTNGTLEGKVLDENGKAIAGAIVKAIHTNSGTVYGTATKANGNFQINGLRVGGPYEVEASMLGASKGKVTDIYIRLGDVTYVTIKTEQNVEQLKEVVISGNKNSIINNQRTGASTNVSAAQLATLPTISRSITDFTRLSPQGGASFSSGLNNANTFAGRDGRYNNFQVNGANLNNGFGLSSSLTPGGSGQPFSLDAIEELQIGVAPFDIRQAGFTGANINAVTKSGTNTLHGSAYGFFRSNGMVGDQVDKINLDVKENTNVIYGARLAGALIKNKLFFFVNGEYEKNTYPGMTWVAKNSTNSGQVSNVVGDSLTKFSNFLSSNYGYKTGAYENYGNFVNQNTKFLGRIDWNINDKNKFYVSYSQLNSSEDNLVNGTSATAGTSLSNSRVGLNSMSFQNSNYSFDHLVQTLSAELNTTINNSWSNQLLGTFSYINDKRSTPGSLFPFIDITSGGSSNYMSAGTELFSYKNDVINRNMIITDNLNINANNHNLTLGASYEVQQFENSFLSGGTMYYRYNSLNDFILNKAPSAFGYTYPLPSQNGNSYVKANYSQISAYFQDRFNVASNLVLNFGIRFELPFYDNSTLSANANIDALNFKDQNGNTLNLTTGRFPTQKPMISPRMSFNWDVFNDKSLQVRGGTGVFTGRIPFVWLTNQAGGIGTLTNQVQITDAATLSQMKFYQSFDQLIAGTPSIASKFPSSAPIPSTIVVVDQNFKMPQLWKTDIAVDYKLPWYGLIASAEYMFSKDIYNVYQYNANLPTAQSNMTNGDDTRPYWTNTKNVSTVTNAMVLGNTTRGYSNVFTLGISRSARKGLYGSLYYTKTYAEDVSSNPGSQSASAWNGLPNNSSPNAQVSTYSQYMTPDRVVGSLSYRFEYAKRFATTISLFYEGASAGRFSYLYNSDINGDGVNADLIYVPMSGSQINFAQFTSNGKTFTVADQQAAWDAYVAQDDYLSSHKGQYAERYGAQFPWYSRFDMKLVQEIGLVKSKDGQNHKLEITLDIFNVANLLNPAWGIQQQLSIGTLSNRQNILNKVSGTTTPVFNMATTKDAAGNTILANSTFTNVNTTFSTWSSQLGLRYSF
jgi:hypothetical protein